MLIGNFYGWQRVFFITICYLLIGMLIAVYDHLTLMAYELPEGHSLPRYMVAILFGTLFGGIVAGSFIVFVLREKLKNMPFGKYLLVSALVFIILIPLVALIGTFVAAMITRSAGPTDPEVWMAVKDFMFSPTLFKVIIIWFLIGFATTLVLQVNDKYGPGVLMKMMVGRYHQPAEEDRIFMFLDLTGSTTLAEKMGHKEYFRFLRDFFADSTAPVLNNAGEIYQYVGDEMVISWPLKKGIKNARFIRCYYEIENEIQKQSAIYLQKYGSVPGFKASFHCGMVTAGEIGILKKDIVYTGDVLNTCARMLEQCKVFKVRTIISDQLAKQVELPVNFAYRYLAELPLRGKEEKVELYTIEKLPEEKSDTGIINLEVGSQFNSTR